MRSTIGVILEKWGVLGIRYYQINILERHG